MDSARGGRAPRSKGEHRRIALITHQKIVVRKMYLLTHMIQPLQANGALLQDIAAARVDRRRFHVWWLGQSGFLVHWHTHYLLLDPYLSDSLTRKYADTDKPHVRMTERVIAPEQLAFVNVVTSSHNHTDHLDAETLQPMRAINPRLRFVIPEANRLFVAERLDCPVNWPVGVDAGTTIALGPFHITGVPAAHEAVERDEKGRCKFLGYVVRFGPWTVYHSGDTVWYDGLVKHLRQFSIDLALLPINGRAFERRVAGNLWGREAAQLAHDVGARCVIPCHYDLFEFNTATPDEFRQTCERLKQSYQILQAGERWNSPASPSPLAGSRAP